MYNRYIPQGDGSFRKSSVPDPMPKPLAPSCPPIPEERPCMPPPPSQPSCSQCPHRPQGQRPPQPRPHRQKHREPEGVGGFLRNLLPGNFDTEDLMIVLLLLLMSGENQEDGNIPLLTLALYLFL